MMVRLKKKHFDGPVACLTPSWVGNAWWLVRRARVSNPKMVESREVVEQWLASFDYETDIKFKELPDETITEKFLSGDRVAFTVTDLCTPCNYGQGMAHICIGPASFALVNRKLLRLLSIKSGDKLYAKDARSAMTNGADAESSTAIIMPMMPSDAMPDIIAQYQQWLSVAESK